MTSEDCFKCHDNRLSQTHQVSYGCCGHRCDCDVVYRRFIFEKCGPKWYPFGAAVDWHGYWDILLVIVLVWRGLFIFQEAYTDRQFTAIKGDLLVVSKTIIFGSLIVLTVAFVIQSNVPRSLIAFFAVLNFVLLASEKVLLYRLLGYLRRHGINVKKVLVLGAEDVAKAFIDSVEQYPDYGIDWLAHGRHFRQRWKNTKVGIGESFP